MIKRDITETVYEYDKEGKLVKKTVIERHEEEQPNQILNDFVTHNDWWKHNQITCDNPNVATTLLSNNSTHGVNQHELTSNCTIQG